LTWHRSAAHLPSASYVHVLSKSVLLHRIIRDAGRSRQVRRAR